MELFLSTYLYSWMLDGVAVFVFVTNSCSYEVGSNNKDTSSVSRIEPA